MEFCDQPNLRIERDFDPKSDRFGWWWVGFRNDEAFTAGNLLLAIERCRRRDHNYTATR